MTIFCGVCGFLPDSNPIPSGHPAGNRRQASSPSSFFTEFCSVSSPRGRMSPPGALRTHFLWRCNVHQTIKQVLSDKDQVVFWGCVFLSLIAAVLS